jgi:hypothetical protein
MAEPGESGQATVELIAGLPVLLGAGLIALQLLTVGYCSTVADAAAEAGALALAGGRPVAPAVAGALPKWARDRADIHGSGGRIAVELRVPSLLEPLGTSSSVSSSAWARPPAGSG